MWRTWLTVVIVCAAGVAAGECQPAGRKVFADGLQALDAGDLAAAAAAYGQLVQAQPDCPEARNNLAVVLVEQGHIREAAEQLRRALELRPDYHRARLNLERVETLLGPAAGVGSAGASAEGFGPQAGPLPEGPLRPTKSDTLLRSMPPAPASPAVPSPSPQPPSAPPTATGLPASASPESLPSAALVGIAALAPEGATACAVDLKSGTPGQQRLCVYRQHGGAIGAVGAGAGAPCFPILAATVPSGTQWLAASDLDARRIRLVDETGRKRLKIVPQNRSGDGMVTLRQADFDTLSSLVTPWRTGWIVSASAPAPRDDAALAAEVRSALDGWRAAWEEKRFEDYVGYYGGQFALPDETVARWRARKQSLFEQPGAISVQLEAPSIYVLDNGAAVITAFQQTYRSPTFASVAQKVLRWQRDDTGARPGRWAISTETVLTEQQQ